MRVVMVTNNYTPFQGGVVSSINATIQQLHAQGHEVILVTLDFGCNSGDPEWLVRIPSLLYFSYHGNPMAIPWRPMRFLKQLIERVQPDCVHVHHPFLLGPLAASIARKKNIKIIFTYHTLYEYYTHYIPLLGEFSTPLVMHAVFNFCKKVDEIIVPSDGVQRMLAHHGITHTIVQPSRVQAIFLAQSWKPKILKKPIHLLSVGRLEREKNVYALFKTLSLLPKMYTLTIVGHGSLLNELKKSAYNEYRFSKQRVTFVIKPDIRHLITLYRRAHLFLFSSYSDTQGLVINEAMACGTPVIALDGIGQRDSIQNNINGMIVPNEVHMAQQIKYICQDTQRYHQWCKNAYASMKNRT